MKVAKYEETKEKLKKDGMDEDEIEEEIDKLKKQYEGMISKKSVLAHILAKKRGLISVEYKGGGNSKGSPKEINIEDLEEDMNNIMVRCYVVDRDLTETKKGDERSVCRIVDETGDAKANVFGEGSAEWNYKHGQAVKMSGGSYKYTEGVGFSTWNKPEPIDEGDKDDMMTLDEIVNHDIPELSNINKQKFVCVEGLCSDVHRRPYEACKNCHAKPENCKCDGNYGTIELEFDTITLLSSEGDSSVKVDVDPSIDIPENTEFSFVKVYGLYSTTDDEPSIELTKFERLVGKSPTPFLSQDTVEELTGFIERYGEVPKDMFHKYVKNNTDVRPVEGVVDHLVDEGVLSLNDDDKVVMK